MNNHIDWSIDPVVCIEAGSPTYYEMLYQKTNYREYVNGMSKCTACLDSDKQKTCKGYAKATHENRCMYLRFGWHCDNRKKEF